MEAQPSSEEREGRLSRHFTDRVQLDCSQSSRLAVWTDIGSCIRFSGTEPYHSRNLASDCSRWRPDACTSPGILALGEARRTGVCSRQPNRSLPRSRVDSSSCGSLFAIRACKAQWSSHCGAQAALGSCVCRLLLRASVSRSYDASCAARYSC